MTTIKLKKVVNSVTYNIELFGTEIDEQIDKTFVNWADIVQASQWDSKPAKRNSMDMKNITDSFTLSARIDAYSIGTPSTTNAPFVRDLLRAFVLDGGTSTLYYGDATDIVGLNSAIVNSSGTSPGTFYTSTGFEVHISRLSIKETPKGGDSLTQTSSDTASAVMQVPTSYNVQMTLQIMTEYTA